MSDELSPEIVDQIVFGMENQEQSFLFDTEACCVVALDAVDENEHEHYISLPQWNSAMGFQLMERFVSTLRNPMFRDILRETLTSGRGVFRKFKNALKDRPDIEQLWFRFKEREMRRLVYDWYNEHRESIGLDRIAFSEEETEELVLSDFLISEPETVTPELLDLVVGIDRAAFEEMYADYPEAVVELLYTRARRGGGPDTGKLLLVETPYGELSGFLWFEYEYLSGGGEIAWIRQLTVVEEFRGLGIARTLLDTFLDRAAKRGAERVLFEISGDGGDCSRAVEAYGFEALSTTYALDLSEWESSS